MSFDPNAQKQSKRGSFDWATYIPTRRPKFKVHENRGYATAAIKYTSHSVQYEEGLYCQEIPHGIQLFKKDTEGKWQEVTYKKFYRDDDSILVENPND